jgi:hypothetical protein
MATLFRCGLAALLAVAWARTNALADDSAVVEQHGFKFRYNEKVVLESLDLNADELRRALTRDGSDCNHRGPLDAKAASSLETIGWLVIALGEYSNGSNAVKEAIFKLKSDLGCLSLPTWMGWDERRKSIAQFYSFRARENEFVLPKLPPVETVYTLCTGAEKRITARSGFKFEGYHGPAFVPVD